MVDEIIRNQGLQREACRMLAFDTGVEENELVKDTPKVRQGGGRKVRSTEYSQNARGGGVRQHRMLQSTRAAEDCTVFLRVMSLEWGRTQDCSGQKVETEAQALSGRRRGKAVL